MVTASGSGQMEAAKAVAAHTSTNTTASTSKVAIDRDRRRCLLRAENLRIWREGAATPTGPLDSNIKKNTAFIKRIRQTLGVETRDQLIKEVATLNLDRYIEEIVQAIPEGLAKCANAKDHLAAAESLSALHGRFDTALFAQPLEAQLSTLLAMPSRAALQAMPTEQREKEEQVRVARQKVLMRVVAELALTEMIRSDRSSAKAEPDPAFRHPGQEWLYLALRDLLANDREHANVPILIALLKGLGPTLLGAKEEDATSQLASLSLDEEEAVLGKEAQAKLRKLCEMYFATLGKRIVKEHARLQEQDQRNHEAYIRSGEIFEDRQQRYEKMAKGFERMHELGKALSELLGVEMPAMSSDSKASAVGLAVNLDARSSLNERAAEEEYAHGKSKWEDEETRRFYEDLLDLEDMVPLSLLQGSTGKAEKAETDKAEAGTAETAVAEAKAEPPSEAKPMSPNVKQGEADAEDTNGADAATDSKAEMGASHAAQLNAFLATLLDMSNRAMIDSAAVDFAFLNNKLARRRLVKHLLAIPRARSDLIPYYARLIATLNRYMPDVGQGVLDGLEEEFRFLQRKRSADMAETRAKNARFIGELVKFGITPLITIFHVFKVCLDDFGGPNIDNIATLLETCGRYLLRNEETGERMRSTLELLRRKRAAQNLDARQLVVLDNAYYQCNPPEREATVTKQRTPMQRYIHHLVYDVLARHREDKVRKQLRKLDWQDATVHETLFDVFCRAWRIRYSNLHLLAVLLYDLQVYHADFVVRVIDTVCEQVRTGMETNIFKQNQRRVATIKYLGEMYNYRLIGTDLLFGQLWSMVTFGHPQGQPLPGQVSPLDAPDDYFRIRLICTLLHVCGACFERGALRQRLDDYLLLFNVYILSKAQPIPMDVEFMLSETLESLRPQFVLKRDFAEAAEAVDAMLERQRQAEAALAVANAAKSTGATGVKNGTEAVASGLDEGAAGSDSASDSEDDSASSVSDSDGDEAPRHISKDDVSTDSESSTSGEEDEEDEDEEGNEEEEDEEMAQQRQRSAVDQEAEDEFEREFAKMMAESTAPSASNNVKRGLFDVGIPFIKKTIAASADASVTNGGAGPQAAPIPALNADGQHMRFSLLSKRGNRQVAQDVHVPIDAEFAVRSREAEQRHLAERQQMKRLVLGMETREETEDRVSLEATMARRGGRARGNRGD